MICSLPCVSGANDTANLTRSATAPNISAGIFAPPYAINNGNEQLPLNTRTMPVTASHYDGAHPHCVAGQGFKACDFDLFDLFEMNLWWPQPAGLRACSLPDTCESFPGANVRLQMIHA